jgi:hypothetical protein
MFKIIGADGRQYGPVSADQLRQWIAQARVNSQTLVQAEGSVDWKRLGEFPEFGPPSPPVSPPTPLMPTASVPGPVPAPAVYPKTNSMAVAGLTMGVIGVTIGWICCGPLFSVLGIIFSSIGLSQINREPTRQAGRGVAIGGLVLSILSLIAAIGFGMLFAMRSFTPGRHLFSWRYHW